MKEEAAIEGPPQVCDSIFDRAVRHSVIRKSLKAARARQKLIETLRGAVIAL